jgi:hypothetical protein
MIDMAEACQQDVKLLDELRSEINKTLVPRVLAPIVHNFWSARHSRASKPVNTLESWTGSRACSRGTLSKESEMFIPLIKVRHETNCIRIISKFKKTREEAQALFDAGHKLSFENGLKLKSVYSGQTAELDFYYRVPEQPEIKDTWQSRIIHNYGTFEAPWFRPFMVAVIAYLESEYCVEREIEEEAAEQLAGGVESFEYFKAIVLDHYHVPAVRFGAYEKTNPYTSMNAVSYDYVTPPINPKDRDTRLIVQLEEVKWPT